MRRRKGGDKSIGEEKHPETVLRRARLTESRGVQERRGEKGKCRVADELAKKTANERVEQTDNEEKSSM